MAATQPERSFDTSRVAGDSAPQYHGSVEPRLLQSDPTSSDPHHDQPEETYRAGHQSTESDYLLRALIQNSQWAVYSPIIIALLKLDELHWDCIQHLRYHDETSRILQPFLSSLYQIPPDMATQLEGIRSAREWRHNKEDILRNLTAGTSPAISRPTSFPPPAFPHRNSTASLAPSINRSSLNSVNSMYQNSIPATPQDIAETGSISIYTPSSYSSPAIGTPPAIATKDERLHWCLSVGCGRRFTRPGDLRNHVRHLHPDSQQAMAMISQPVPKHAPAHAAVGKIPVSMRQRKLFGEMTKGGNNQSSPSLPPTPLQDHALLQTDFTTLFDNHTMEYDDPLQNAAYANDYFQNSSVQVLDHGNNLIRADQLGLDPTPNHGTPVTGVNPNLLSAMHIPIKRTYSGAQLGNRSVRDSMHIPRRSR